MTRIILALAIMLGLVFPADAAYRGALVRKALVGGVAINQSIPNTQQPPYPTLTFDQVIYDTEACFDAADSSFVIPSGVTYARIGVQAVWSYNPTGIRQLVIMRKSPLNADPTKYEFFTADPVSTQQANTNTTTDMETHTIAAIPVIAGERYKAFPFQTSGVALDISGGTGTVFGIEFP